MFSNSGVKCGGCSINRRIVIKVADLVSLVLYTPNRSFQQASRSSLLDSNELIFMGVWGNWSVGYILFTETADVTSATPLLYAIRYLRQGYRSFIWSTVPCEVWFCLLLDHFLATFSPFLRLLIILQIYKVQPYFRTFVPTGSSLKISLLQVSPSLTFFFTLESSIRSLDWEDPPEKGEATYSSILAWRIPWTTCRVGHDWATFTFIHLFRSPLRCYFLREMLPDPLPAPKLTPYFVLLQSIFYFSCIAVTRIVVKLFI